VKLPVYQSRAYSGSDWLGDIPKCWEITRLKFLLAKNDGGVWGEEDDPDGTIVLRSTDQTLDGGWKIEDPARRSLTLKEQKKCRLESGDLVVTKSSGSALHIGKTSLVNREVAAMRAWFSNFMQRLRVSNSLDPRIAFYLLNSPTGRQQSVVNSNTTTGLANLNGTVLGDIVLAVPSLGEQRAIADFLDRETARLDTLVGKKRELIEKLKEKRTALISRTVTRGLPAEAAAKAGLKPHPKLKPSGIEWLGDVPEHWEVKQLKWAVMFQRGHDLPADAREEGPIPLVTSAGISSTHSQAAAKAPGIVTGRYGTIGEFHLITEDYWPLNTTLYTISLRENEPRFLRYMLSHLSPLFLLNAVKSAVPGVDRNDIHPTKAAVPPVPEQRDIADYLDRETEKIDKMIEKVEAAIEKLQEYRTALITAAVTGKIDVRGEANSVGSTGALAAGTLPA
jgi:type I restriction enzyme S subunit